MELQTNRFANGSNSTLSFFYEMLGTHKEFLGFVCEDEHRDVKVPKETCIPAGRYEIKLRNEGGMTKRYAEKWADKGYPEIHRGMLHLQNVKNFEWVYVHVGNTEEHTEGCLLVGYDCNHDPVEGGGSIGQSVDCYIALYKRCLKAFDKGEKVFITIREGI